MYTFNKLSWATRAPAQLNKRLAVEREDEAQQEQNLRKPANLNEGVDHVQSGRPFFQWFFHQALCWCAAMLRCRACPSRYYCHALHHHVTNERTSKHSRTRRYRGRGKFTPVQQNATVREALARPLPALRLGAGVCKEASAKRAIELTVCLPCES